MSQEYIISLEVGSSATKIAAATFDGDRNSPLTVVALDSQSISDGVRYGRIQNVEDVTAATLRVLDRISKNNAIRPRKITGVYVAIGGRSLGTIHASASLTLPEEREITQDIINRLKEEALGEVPDNREALEIIPLNFNIDGVSASRPVGSFGTRISGEFTIIICDPVNERNLKRVVNNKLNLDICGYIVRPLAIARTTLTIDDTNPGCMLVDIGAETTTVAIFRQSAPQYIATIPLGSRNITRDIAAGMGIVEEKAEDIKRRLGNAISDHTNNYSHEQIEIDSYVQPRALEIVANIVAHIGFAGMTAADLRSGIIVTGRGAKLRGLCQLLQTHSQLPVRMATIPSSIRIADPNINAADNIDVISLCAEARRYALLDDAIPCVEAPISLEEKDDATISTKKDTTHAETHQPVDHGYDTKDEDDQGDGFTHGSFGDPDNYEYDDEPGRQCDESYDEVLMDSEQVIENRRRRSEKEIQRAEKERERNERIAREGHVSSNNSDEPGRTKIFFDKIWERINKAINTPGEGAGLDDDD